MPNQNSNENYSFFIVMTVFTSFLAVMFFVFHSMTQSVQEGAPDPSEQVEEVTYVEASEDDDPFIGSPDAPVTIIEFSDYQCPFCKNFFIETYPLLKKDYIETGKVKLVFRDLPLSFHPNAGPASEAASCVGVHGNEAYFKMHDLLFSEQEIWSPKSVDEAKNYFIAEAKNKLGYDITSCLNEGEMASEVQKDLNDARSYGFGGTPSFTINGNVLIGAYPYAEFVRMIEAELTQ